jgi:hypothetical protein
VSEGLTLSKTETRELTRTPIRRRQVEFLVRNGIRHYLDAGGWPVVLRSAVESAPDPAGGKPLWKPRKAA